MYLYPTEGSLTSYYYGSIHPKLSIDVSLTDVERFTLDGTGDGALSKN